MPDYPLLLFPKPETADKSNGTRWFPRGLHKPTHEQQGKRLSPIFQRLQNAFDKRLVEIQQTAAGADPEQVLVIEIVGSVENFANAVKRIKGLEWLGEIEIDDIEPDGSFYDEENGEKSLGGRLYLVISDQKALKEMLSLWRRYKEDEDMEFEYGFAKFRDVFNCLKNIRRWDVQDRLYETGLFDAWREDLKADGNRLVRLEVELWFRAADEKREKAGERIETLISDLSGMVLSGCVINDIAYHALLAEIPAASAQQIMEHSDVELMKCDEVMFFRPVGQMTTGEQPMDEDLSDYKIKEEPLPSGDPVIAILDGLPLENHELLQGRLRIDDPDDYASEYEASSRVHGTSMASLVVHGDLNDKAPALTKPVYARPVMKPRRSGLERFEEALPDDVLMVDYIHRAVRRMFEREGSGDAVSPTVRVINFSIGDRRRQFMRELSPLAKLLDWLSFKYQVLFVVSAGNHSDEIRIDMPKAKFNSLPAPEKEKEVVKALYENERHRKILSPAESMNSITVGALHYDTTEVSPPDSVFNLFEKRLPSPISAFGGGYRRSIKPDFLFNGGRVLYREPYEIHPDARFQMADRRSPPGNQTASPSRVPGELRKVGYSCGTSNAAALTSRMAAFCHDTLLEIFEEQGASDELDRHIAPLIKTMVVHGCSWGEIENHLRAALDSEMGEKEVKSCIRRWLGYGVPDHNRVLTCTGQRATLLGYGQLSDGKAHLFTLPLPPSLSAKREKRVLTVTLAWLSPIAVKTQRYRSLQLWLEVGNGGVGIVESKRTQVDYHTSRRGTVQHEVFESSKAVGITDEDNLTIKVNCRKDAKRIKESVAYGLAVTLEVAEGTNIPIYEEVRNRIAPRVRANVPEGQ